MHGTSLVNVRHLRRAVVLAGLARLRRRAARRLPVAVAYRVIPTGAALPSGRLAGARTVLPAAGSAHAGPETFLDTVPGPGFDRFGRPLAAVVGASDRSFYPTVFGTSTGDRSRPGTGSRPSSVAPAPAAAGRLPVPVRPVAAAAGAVT